MKRFFIAVFLSLLLFLPMAAMADQYGLDTTAGAAGLGPGTKFAQPIQTLIGNVIGAALAMIAVLFFILMLYGGILWMTAHGNTDQVTKAKDALIAATVGMVIVVAAYALTNFVFQSIGASGGSASQQRPGQTSPTGDGTRTVTADELNRIIGSSGDKLAAVEGSIQQVDEAISVLLQNMAIFLSNRENQQIYTATSNVVTALNSKR